MNYLIAQWEEHIENESWLSPTYSINAGYNNKSVEEIAKKLSLNKEKNRVEVYELPTSTLCEYIIGEKIK